MQQTLGIERQIDTGDPLYRTDRTLLPPPQQTLGQFCSTRIPRWIIAKRRAPEVLEQSGALVPGLPSPLPEGKAWQAGTFVLSGMLYSLTPGRTCQFPLRMAQKSDVHSATVVGRSTGSVSFSPSPGGCSNRRAACLGAVVPARHQFCDRAPSAALEMP